MEFDDILKKVGDAGRAQVLLMFLVYVLFGCAGWQQLTSLFVARDVDFYCTDSTDNSSSATQPENNSSSVFYDNICVEGCSQYVYTPGLSSINIDFNLDCGEKEHLKKFIHSAYWVGYLTGCMFSGYLGDKTGRKPTSIITLAIGLIISFATIFCPNIELFLLFRLIVGVCQGGYFPLAFIVLTESVNKKYLGAIAMSCMALYAVGESMAPVTGFVFKSSWKYQLVTATCVFGISLIISLLLLPESPRWLYTQGKYAKADAILNWYAKLNGNEAWTESHKEREALLKENQKNEIMSKQRPYKEGLEEKSSRRLARSCERSHTASIKKKNDVTGHNSPSFFALFGTFQGALVTMSQMLTWAGCAFIFYGFNYNAQSMGTNLYLTSLLLALSELPAVLLFKLSDRVGRKIVVLLGLGFGTVASFVLEFSKTFLADVVILSAAIFAKFMLASALNTLYSFTPETFPTILRGSALAYSSASQNLSVIVASVLVKTVAEPFIIFGCFGIFCTLFLLFFGRETLKIPLLNSLEAFHNFAKNRELDSNLGRQDLKKKQSQLT